MAGLRRGIVQQLRGGAAVDRFDTDVAKIALAAAVSLPNSSPVGLAMLWIAITAEEVWFWRRSRRLHGLPTNERLRSPAPRSGRTREDRVESQKSHSETALPPLGSDVVQRLIRTHSAAGVERIEGWLKATAQPGERNADICTSHFARRLREFRNSRRSKPQVPPRESGRCNCCPTEYDWS